MSESTLRKRCGETGPEAESTGKPFVACLPIDGRTQRAVLPTKRRPAV